VPAPLADPPDGPAAQAIERFALASRCARPDRVGRVRLGLRLRLARTGRVRILVERAVGTEGIARCPRPNPGRRFEGRFEKLRTLNRAGSRRLALTLKLRPGLYRVSVRAYRSKTRLTRPARRFVRVLNPR
jgi:hypothetical protein